MSQFLDHSSLAVTTAYLRRLEGQTDETWDKVAEAIGCSSFATILVVRLRHLRSGVSMATFSTIDASQAPRRPAINRALRLRMEEYNSYLSKLRKGQVGKLTPDPGETTQALSMRLRRAANRVVKPVEVWAVDEAVYFKLS